MKSLCLILFCIAFTVSAFDALVDLRLRRNLSYSCFCYIDLKESHSGQSPVQPYSFWNFFTIPIPKGSGAVQLTVFGRDNRTHTSAMSSRIASLSHYMSGENEVIRFGLEYWSDPFRLYIGWLHPLICMNSGNETRC